jgi:hypothetical protein
MTFLSSLSPFLKEVAEKGVRDVDLVRVLCRE